MAKLIRQVHAIYNVSSGSLALLQMVPEFAPVATNIRQYMIGTDLLSGAMSHYFLSKRIRNRQWDGFSTGIAIMGVALPAVYLLQSLFSHSGDLSELAPHRVSAKFDTPNYGSLQQFINVCRLFSTFRLSAFSTAHKGFNYFSILSQVVGLSAPLSLPWFHVNQSELSSKYGDSLQNGEIRTYAILSSTAAKTHPILKGAIASIAMLQRRFLLTGAATLILNSSNVVRIYYRLKEILDLSEYIKKPCHWGGGGAGDLQ